MTKVFLVFILIFVGCIGLEAQDLQADLLHVQRELQDLRQEERVLLDRLESLRLAQIRADLTSVGLPSDNYVEHSALFLAYDEEHEQARWVAHIIHPQIKEGQVGRSNDFREDPKVRSGSAVEADYFLKTLLADSTYEYDGYGYDRGHLAPSADFRWSARALSESYFYSNMSPQRPEFNRGKWAELESFLRGYVISQDVQLYVVTGPVLQPDLPKVERSVNAISLPDTYFKVAVDLENQRGIGFLMPNQDLDGPLEVFAVAIDEVEEIAGLDFFNRLPESEEKQLESVLDKEKWFSGLARGEAEPLYPPSLPRNHFNTIQAARYAGTGESIHVCGTVVSARFSRSGNLWMNLDKKFPNQVFSIYIRKDDLANFPYAPLEELMGKVVCFEGEVSLLNGTPTLQVDREKKVEIWVD